MYMQPKSSYQTLLNLIKEVCLSLILVSPPTTISWFFWENSSDRSKQHLNSCCCHVTNDSPGVGHGGILVVHVNSCEHTCMHMV